MNWGPNLHLNYKHALLEWAWLKLWIYVPQLVTLSKTGQTNPRYKYTHILRKSTFGLFS